MCGHEVVITNTCDRSNPFNEVVGIVIKSNPEVVMPEHSIRAIDIYDTAMDFVKEFVKNKEAKL